MNKDGSVFTVVDTPGFGDSNGEDGVLIDEMVKALKDDIKTTNGCLILFNGEDDRYNNFLQQMLREIVMIFGNGFWDNAILGFSHWAFDQSAINKRNIT